MIEAVCHPGRANGTFPEKFEACSVCSFHRWVELEEGRFLSLTPKDSAESDKVGKTPVKGE